MPETNGLEVNEPAPKVLISAGPTHEPIDPVRYLGNRSSGKMGFALAAAAAARGARTTLVAGPVGLETPDGVDRLDVVTALDMQAAIGIYAAEADLIIMTAAVADFRPARPLEKKFKKEDGTLTLELVPNPDILVGLAALAPDAVRVGFAAETDITEARIRAKFERKNVDFMVLNDVSRQDIGFAVNENEVTVYRRDDEPIFYPRRSKHALADDLIGLFFERLTVREPALVG